MTETITWIPVAERLPDTNGYYLSYEETKWKPIDTHYFCITSKPLVQMWTKGKITHWAQLPKGPMP